MAVGKLLAVAARVCSSLNTWARLPRSSAMAPTSGLPMPRPWTFPWSAVTATSKPRSISPPSSRPRAPERPHCRTRACKPPLPVLTPCSDWSTLPITTASLRILARSAAARTSSRRLSSARFFPSRTYPISAGVAPRSSQNRAHRRGSLAVPSRLPAKNSGSVPAKMAWRDTAVSVGTQAKMPSSSTSTSRPSWSSVAPRNVTHWSRARPSTTTRACRVGGPLPAGSAPVGTKTCAKCRAT